ncbi:MAG: hypothetical protein JWN85_3405 [Gammaproteobacteria bacterium]|nr:hypothetical protein [Gammaproteobacteria bacterium]
MGESRAVWFAPIASLFFGTLLSGCADNPGKLPALSGTREARSSTDPEVACSRHPYGEVKNGLVEKSQLPADVPSASAAAGGNVAVAGKVLVQSRPLDALPPEIARIQRGLVKRFVGKFVKDGMQTWSGVDLDRLRAVSVERRVFDRRAHLPRPVADPEFSPREQSSFARKWSEPERTEVEVVSSFPISLAEAQAFVCAANPDWAAKGPIPDEDPDDLTEGATDFFLLDRRREQDVAYRYAKPLLPGPGLAVALGTIWQHAPVSPAW